MKKILAKFYATLALTVSMFLCWWALGNAMGLPTIKKSVTEECVAIIFQNKLIDCSEKKKILEKTGGRYHQQWIAPKFQ